MAEAIMQIRTEKKLWPGHKPKDYFFFTLTGDNDEPVAQGEQYTQKHNMVEVLDKYFPNFTVVDHAYKKFPPNVR
jgi:hypothetical protein